MGTGKARPVTTQKTRKATKPWNPRTEPKTEFGRWFRDHKLSYDVICKTLSCGSGYAYELLNGTRTPSLESAVKLISMSHEIKGARDLTAGDFLPD